MERKPMTPAGYAKLQEELKRLKSVERPKAIQAIAEARAHGDLSENAEYDAAKHAQSLLEGRIKEVEARISLAQIIDPMDHVGSEKVVFGAKVSLEDTDEGAESVYQIVGEDEADVKQGLISVTSPMARALIGKELGDTVVVQTPGGKREYDIVKVEYVPVGA
jgi:transcription elongation factor GreA